MKLFENVEIKNLISIVALVVWIGLTAYGCATGKFDDVFAYGQTIITAVVMFFVGYKYAEKNEKENE